MHETAAWKPHRSALRVMLILLAAAILVPVQVSARTKRQKPAVTPYLIDACVFFGNGETVILRGYDDDLAVARKYRDQNSGPMIWFRRAGNEYVTDDRKVIRPVIVRLETDANWPSGGGGSSGGYWAGTSSWTSSSWNANDFATATVLYTYQTGVDPSPQKVAELVNSSYSYSSAPSQGQSFDTDRNARSADFSSRYIRLMLRRLEKSVVSGVARPVSANGGVDR